MLHHRVENPPIAMTQEKSGPQRWIHRQNSLEAVNMISKLTTACAVLALSVTGEFCAGIE
jgi:hypothetical protein